MIGVVGGGEGGDVGDLLAEALDGAAHHGYRLVRVRLYVAGRIDRLFVLTGNRHVSSLARC